MKLGRCCGKAFVARAGLERTKPGRIDLLRAFLLVLSKFLSLIEFQYFY
jgi:hypothetical protein